MKNAVLLHGCCDEAEFFGDGPSPSNSHWLPWVQKQLLMRGFDAQTPEMPRPYEPAYEDWKEVLARFPVGRQTTLIAHSCATGFLLRWLAETHCTVGRVLLVAPWLDPHGVRGEFLRFRLDASIAARTEALAFLYSAEDTVEGVQESVAILAQTFRDATFVRFEDKGHFTSTEKRSMALPELLEMIA